MVDGRTRPLRLFWLEFRTGRPRFVWVSFALVNVKRSEGFAEGLFIPTKHKALEAVAILTFAFI
jgi:hypothetical protein